MLKVCLILNLAVLFIIVGCSSNDGGEKYVEEKEEAPAWLTRKATPESAFSPTEIESAIDSIVAALNETDPVVGMKAAFIPKVLDAFFEPATIGTNRAFAELDILGNVIAPNVDSQADLVNLQKALIDEQIEEGIFNFGLAPVSDILDESINAAVAAEGAIVTFDSDAPNSERQLYLGTINEEAGKTAGNTMLNYIGTETLGTVIVYGFFDMGWKDGYDRSMEASNVLTAAGHTVVMAQSDWNSTETEGSGLPYIKEVLKTADPPVVGCLGLFNISFHCADAVVAENLQSQVKVVAFDTELKTMDYMNQGIIQATHIQRVYYMGYLTPYLIYSINTLGLEETKSLVSSIMVDDYRIDTGLDVVPADGIEDYYAFQAELSSL